MATNTTTETHDQLLARLAKLQKRADELAKEAEQAKGRLQAADKELADRWGCRSAAEAEKLLAEKRKALSRAKAEAAKALEGLRVAVDALERAVSGEAEG